jgi:indolepyruvate ferredoxin oxidoreductase beta subunit
MKTDIILAGVGGQGVLSVAAIIAQAAVKEGLTVRQSEVHGMAQRGGAVISHLRISAGAIAGDLIPRGEADIIISMEVLESLRYAAGLSPQGSLVTAVKSFVNIPDYPELKTVTAALPASPAAASLRPRRWPEKPDIPRQQTWSWSGPRAPSSPLPRIPWKTP